MNSDVIVIGAGASGLAAARELARHGCQVTLLEGRDRIGGRVLSVKPSGWPFPAELGAEFVHGGSPAIKRRLKKTGLKTKSSAGGMSWIEHGKIRHLPDFWTRIRRVANRIPKADLGWSFQHFLQEERTHVAYADRVMASHYVGSFNAAPVAKMSAHASRAHHAGADTNDLKLLGPYRKVLEELTHEWREERVTLRLNAIVTSVEWKAGQVTVRTRSAERKSEDIYMARAAIVTLPLGVLQKGSVVFRPTLGRKQQLIRKLGWGQAVRVTIRFRRGFWTAPFMPKTLGARQGRSFGFINARAEAMPVWWALTAPAPILTAWSGGDAARKIAHLRPKDVFTVALRSLAHILSVSMKELRGWVVGWQAHDWGNDPFALGAYSYAVAGLDDGPEQLAEPLRNTLFFAGEATAEELGTVHGALDSGVRAAKAVVAVLKRK